ncbi:MAG: UDP-N-acetylmuramate--L-alanine ligase [Bdellovibrionales bacterium]
MNRDRPYFFCGIGGSGMMPLALTLKEKGCDVEGSDRSLDQGRTKSKFSFLRDNGIKLHAQDGSGLTNASQILVTSAAVEESVPDVVKARELGCEIVTRAQLLASLFNAAPYNIAVAGTSGKSTVTGMIGWILHSVGREPTVMNGAVMKNFVTDDVPFASALVGSDDLMVAEVDESDGSIAYYNPHIAVLNNIAFDHKPLDELRQLFGDFVKRSEFAILNLDNPDTAALAGQLSPEKEFTFSLDNPKADLVASEIVPSAEGISFKVTNNRNGKTWPVSLVIPGRHNVANALAAMAATLAYDVLVRDAADALNKFKGIRRRLELIGTAGGVTIIDDFAHNPDKINAMMQTLHQFPGRVLVMFQPHGFGPLRLMRKELVQTFIDNLRPDDVLLMPDPVYYGGTTNRTVTSVDLVNDITAAGRNAIYCTDRDACGDKLVDIVQPGDRIVVMGARDDTLPQFARELLDRIEKRAAA